MTKKEKKETRGKKRGKEERESKGKKGSKRKKERNVEKVVRNKRQKTTTNFKSPFLRSLSLSHLLLT